MQSLNPSIFNITRKNNQNTISLKSILTFFSLLSIALSLLSGCASTSEISRLETKINSLELQIQNDGDVIDQIKKTSDVLLVQINALASKTSSNSATSQVMPPEVKVTESSTSSSRCKAITANGNQCKRNAQQGSDFCWQHQQKSKPTVSNSSSTSGDRNIMTGPRGGQYYINKNGNKTYIRKKK